MKWGRTKFILTCLIFFTLGFNLVLPFFTKQEPVSAATVDIGNKTGDTWNNQVTGRIRAVKATCTQSGTVTKLYAELKTTSSTHTSKMYLADSSGNTLKESNQVTITTTAQWYEFTITSQAVSSGTDYYIGVMSDDGSNTQGHYNSAGGTLYYQGGLTWPTIPSPQTYSTSANAERCLYMTVTYTSRQWKNSGTGGWFAFANATYNQGNDFGNLQGATWTIIGGGAGDRIRALKDSPSHSGYLNSVKAYINSTGNAINVKCYVENSTGHIIKETETKSVNVNTGTWVTFNFSSAVNITTGSNYYLGMFCSDDHNLWILTNQSVGAGYLYYQDSLTWPTLPNPASYSTYEPQVITLFGNYTYYQYTKAWITPTTGYFSFSNSSSIKDTSSGYFTLQNTASFNDATSGYFSLQNSSSIQSISSGYFSLSNTSQYQSVTDGWFKFQSDRAFSDVTSGYFILQNSTSFKTFSTGYITFQNTSSLHDTNSGYFTFSNGASWQSLQLYGEKLYEHADLFSMRTSFWGNNWRGQSFTPTTTHAVSHIAFYGNRYRNPGTIYYGIKATTGGKPSGGWLVTGTFDSSVLPDRQIGGTPIWVDLYFSTPYTVNAGTMYAMIFYAVGDSSNWVDINYDAGSYAGGTYLATSNGGSTWTTASFDHAFREYGLSSIGTSGHFTFSNTGTFTTVTSGFVSFRNTSTYKTLYDGWFTFQNVTTGWQTLSSGWFSFANTATIHTALSGYFSFTNASAYKTALEGYFLFSSGVTWFSVEEGFFSFQNSSILTTITSGWFNFSNASSIQTVRSGWFSFAHTPAWRNVMTGYFRFYNVSNWVTLTSGWFRFENLSNATPIPRIILPHPGATVKYTTPFLVTYSVYSSKKEPVNVSLQVIYLGKSGWVNLTNQALNSNQYWLNSTIDISLVMAALGITADYNSPYTLNLNATNYVTHLYDDTQSNFRLRDSTYDLIILLFPLIILILFSLLSFWKQSKIILTATITTAILYAAMLASTFAGTIDSMYVVLLIVYALSLSTMYFFWKKKGPTA